MKPSKKPEAHGSSSAQSHSAKLPGLSKASFRRLLPLFVGAVLIAGWQGVFFSRAVNLTDSYRDHGTSGLYFASYQRLYYFYHHLGLFPVAARTVPTDDTLVGAQRFVEEHGSELVNELDHTVRAGERGKILLFALDGLLRGVGSSAGTRPLHAVAFTFSLVALWAAFFWVGRAVMGAMLVLFLGSNPFQLLEVYRNSNLFGWPGTAGILLLAGAVPMLFKKADSRYGYLYLVVSAVFLGTLQTIRPEPLPIFASVAGVYFFFASGPLWKRAGLVFASALLLFSVTAGWNAYFDAKTEKAVALVTAKGGYPYPAFRYAAHRFWHPMYIGLGDLDQKYGHEWNDLQAYELASTILSETSDEYPYTPGSYTLEKFHDAKSHYAMKWEDLPEYNALMKKLFLQRVMGDPVWYAGILCRRVLRVFAETTPLSIQVGNARLAIPWPGWIWLVVIGFAFYRRKSTDLALLLFMTPICLTTILVYSGTGRTFYSIYHLLAAPVLLAWLGETKHVRDIWRKFYAWNPAR